MAQHQILDQELDVDQPAAVVLEIEELADLAAVGVAHLLAHRLHLGAQGVELAAQAQHLGANGLKAFADRTIAGGKACAREGLVLPHPGRFELVLAKGLERCDEQAGLAVGAQAQIGFEQLACGGLARQPGAGALRQPGIDLGGLGRIVLIQEDDVEVGGVAQLLAAELAVADDGEAGLLAVPDLDPAPAPRQGQVEHDVGELG